MSFKRVSNLSELCRHGCSLQVICTFCDNIRTLAGVELALPGNTPIEGLARRFRCRRCGFKQARIKVLLPISSREPYRLP
jgi:hypothetical protein